MPNAWDGISARVMVARGAPAVATTSSGHAATLGRVDTTVALEELLAHAEFMARTAGVPVNLDSERCYGDDAAGVAACVEALAETGAAGCSIEDYDPATGEIDPVDVAAERVAAAATVANRTGMVLTARAERHLYETDPDFDDTLQRLKSYAEAGAGCLYAPGLRDAGQIAAVCNVGLPVNVLITPATPSVSRLAELGVRRISTGGALQRAAMGELDRAVDELLGAGTLHYMKRAMAGADFDSLLDSPEPRTG